MADSIHATKHKTRETSYLFFNEMITMLDKIHQTQTLDNELDKTYKKKKPSSVSET